ncbi:protein PAXX isoform X2 [Mastacembelus armatus]|uniref:PAXX non-homologous end joining factor n=1 Tax=Mastacembelus armatus TaxID=205130 RepID=A0A7N8XUI3_9TELE|nr:protein PAXX isoform X2 [Mastacembelus armatus]
MDGHQTLYCTVLDKTSHSKFLCYTYRKNGIFCICLTDAAGVWSTGHSEDSWSHVKERFTLKSTEDYILKIRSACGSGDMSVVVNDTRAEVHVGSGPGNLGVTLFRLEDQKATEELKELLFRMADCLAQPDCRSISDSPVKNHQRNPTEFEPQQQQNCAPSVTVKRQPSGASLINPGTKKKLQATGVAFDDVYED